MDVSSFNSKHNADKFKQNIDREIENNKKVLFVRHPIDNYDDQFPLWVISELFTFGMLSYFYYDLTTADKKAFAGADYKKYDPLDALLHRFKEYMCTLWQTLF